MEKVVILNNIRSNENVGSIFRTCDASGVSKIILCGYTPAPTDRFGRENKGLVKASLGAEKFIEWQQNYNLSTIVKTLKKEGYKIIAVEQDKKAIDFRNPKLLALNSKLALVFGNEVDGLSQPDLKLCDQIVEIPMKGKKESLNVSVAVGVILFQ